jgi:arylsulfatase A-like enzyme
MDQSVGAVLDRLEDPNGDGNTSDSVRDNTLIVFTSDNGGLYGAEGSPTRNLPLRDGKGSMYEGGIRVPYLVSWTGNAAMRQGAVSSARTSAEDIYPTVLDAAGVLGSSSVPQNTVIDGVSIFDGLEGAAFDRGFQYWHYPHVSPQDNGSTEISGGTFVSAVRKDAWKLIFFYDDRHYELYNLATDLAESTNVLAQNPTVALELSGALNSYLVQAGAQMPISNATGQPVAPPTVLVNLVPGDFNNSGQIDPQDWKFCEAICTQVFRD